MYCVNNYDSRCEPTAFARRAYVMQRGRWQTDDGIRMGFSGHHRGIKISNVGMTKQLEVFKRVDKKCSVLHFHYCSLNLNFVNRISLTEYKKIQEEHISTNMLNSTNQKITTNNISSSI